MDLLSTIRSRCIIRNISTGTLIPLQTELELAEQVLLSLEQGYRVIFEQASFVAGSRKKDLSVFLGALEYTLRGFMVQSLRDSFPAEVSSAYISALRRVWQAGYLLERNVNPLLILENLFLYLKNLRFRRQSI
jgi:hypothetical protein